MTEVSVISAAEYDALVSAQQPPASTTEVAQPALPAPSEEAPEITAEPDTEIEQPEPVQTETPPEDTPPEVTELELPPQTEVDDSAPELNEPIGDTAVLVPEIAPEARPREAPRVAPEPVAPPEPEARPDLDEQPAVAPEPEAEPEVVVEEEPQEAQTPEDTTTEIVTEADKAPAASARPPGRRPAPPPPVEVAEAPEEPEEEAAPEPTPEPAEEPAQDTTEDAIADALSEVLGQPEAEAPVPSGPPLSSGERESSARRGLGLLEHRRAVDRSGADHGDPGAADESGRHAGDRVDPDAQRLGRWRCRSKAGLRGGQTCNHPLRQPRLRPATGEIQPVARHRDDIRSNEEPITC
ncbi:hypothetical protein [Sulfitobacter faviae]|uniref:hypothetical protein n=1 Tax=Sulfitobacter faviae TaxID=1775881 RepID=UPI00398CE310